MNRRHWGVVSSSPTAIVGRWLLIGVPPQSGRAQQEESGGHDEPPHHHEHEGVVAPCGRRVPHIGTASETLCVSAGCLRVPQQVHQSLHGTLMVPDTLTGVHVPHPVEAQGGSMEGDVSAASAKNSTHSCSIQLDRPSSLTQGEGGGH